jgi:Uncharacterized conserved protein
MNGEFSSGEAEQDTEKAGAISKALISFPTTVSVKVVGRGSDLEEAVLKAIEEVASGVVDRASVTVTERGGTWRSMSLSYRASEAEMVEVVYERIRQMPSVKMVF